MMYIFMEDQSLSSFIYHSEVVLPIAVIRICPISKIFIIPLLQQCHLHWIDHQMVYRNIETKLLFKFWQRKQYLDGFPHHGFRLSFYIFNYIVYPLIQAVWLSRGSESRAIALGNWWILLTLGGSWLLHQLCFPDTNLAMQQCKRRAVVVFI